MMDLLFVAYNRVEMTLQSFEALLANTDWDQVDTLFVLDDASTDGTAEYVERRCQDAPVNVVFHGDRFGGPVFAMNWYLDRRHNHEKVDRFAKVDNDFVVCPGWLEEMSRMMTINPQLDILGTEPMHGPPVAGMHLDRRVESARHIGGKGIIRHRAFDCCRPSPSGFNGYHGFTEWQRSHPKITKAWIRPDLPTFGLDQLPLEPWRTLTDRYEAEGWQRRWNEYDSHATAYWQWWTPTSAADEAQRASADALG